MGKKGEEAEKASTTRQAGISPFSHHGGEEAKKLAKKVHDEKKAAMDITGAHKGWPEDAVPDDRWCSWLPTDWTPAVKMTNGGILIQCMVGPLPDRRLFFHKVDLEKYLERELGPDQRGKKPVDIGDADPHKFIHRTDSIPATDYVRVRCNKLHGLSVGEALRNFKYTHGVGSAGKEIQYRAQDLKYDLLRKNITLVSQRPSKNAKPVSMPATPSSSQASPATPANYNARPVPMTPFQPVPATPSMPAPATPAKPAAAAATSTRPAPCTPLRTSSKRAVTEESPMKMKSASNKRARSSGFGSQGNVADSIYNCCYTPLKTKAASSVEDEKSIYSIVGLGFTLGLDGTMLKTLPEILRKAPAQRGDFGKLALVQFEKAFLRAEGF